MARVVWDHQVLDRIVEEVQREASGRLAGDASERAKDHAPVLSGEYRDGITHAVAEDAAGPYGRVIGTHWTSHFIENGTPTSPPFAPLRNGCASIGLRVF
ncbi:MAG: hypothetical protein AAGA99_21100 [Actinomycetota bacterium]